jgi:hypothetical protein
METGGSPRWTDLVKIEPEGRWILEAAQALWHELRSYARTAAAILRHPHQFGREWGASETETLNPLGFAATTVATVAALFTLRRALPGTMDGNDGGSSIPLAVLQATGTYLHLVCLGLLSHALLAVVRRNRSVLGSVALALYAGGLAALTAGVLELLVAVLRPEVRGVQRAALAATHARTLWWLGVPLVASFVLFVSTLASSMAGLHRRAPVLTVLAVLLAFVGTGFLFGAVNPPGSYGLHLKLRLNHHASQWSLSFGLALS